MKKAALTIGLFTLALVSTSFASPKVSTSSTIENPIISSIDGTGGQMTGGNKKLDYNGNSLENQITSIDGTGGQMTGGNKKLD